MDNPEPTAPPQPNTAPEQLPFGERPVKPGTLFCIALGFLAVFCVIAWWNGRERGGTSAPAATSVPASTSTNEYQPQPRNKPTGADAVRPELKGLIQRAAKDYGISEEEARQAFIKGGLQGGYSKQEVEKSFGK